MLNIKGRFILLACALFIFLAGSLLFLTHIDFSPDHVYVFLSCFLVVLAAIFYCAWRCVFQSIFTLLDYLKYAKNSGEVFHPPYQGRVDEIGDIARAFADIIRERKEQKGALKEQIEALDESKKSADFANKAKSEFLANMSHELRTPLNGILGIVQLMKCRDVDNETAEMLDIIDMSSNNLLKIVNDILDLSKIEANEVELEKSPFNIHDTLVNTSDMLVRLASKKNILLHTDLADLDADTHVLGDSLRFSRVILNLVNNAILYTEEGSVLIKCAGTLTDGDHLNVRVEVRDTGVGIPEDQLDQIFGKFVQADNRSSNKAAGTGLGLAISQELVEMMHGEIGVKSILGVGSTFWFEVTLPMTDNPVQPDKQQYFYRVKDDLGSINCVPHREAKILLAEDHYMSILFMRKLFSQIGISNYTIVNTGVEALEAISEGDFDLVLMDCHMPVMNGYDAVRSIRKHTDDSKRKLPVVAMTANVMERDIAYCFEVGMDAHIGKPFGQEVFMDVLSHWINFDDVSFDENSESDLSENISLEHDCEPVVVSSADVAVDDDGPCVDLTILKNTAMGDEDFVSEVIDIFYVQGEEQLKQLKGCCRDGECADWVEAAHGLKGTAACVGAESMRLVCRDAQDLSDGSQAQREEFAKRIEHSYAQACEFLEDYQASSKGEQ